MKRHVAKIKNKIKKAIRIIRNEGFPVFAGKLARRIVYGMVNAVAAACSENKRSEPPGSAPKTRFTEKKVVCGTQMMDGGAGAERLFEDIKADITRAMNK